MRHKHLRQENQILMPNAAQLHQSTWSYTSAIL